jgi:hypothetical protein
MVKIAVLAPIPSQCDDGGERNGFVPRQSAECKSKVGHPARILAELEARSISISTPLDASLTSCKTCAG